MSTSEKICGGCQCGAIRYELSMQPQRVHFCHCRMCQRAMGNVFAALAPVKRASLRWLGAEPSFFRSSSVAERSFCSACGTPLSFGYVGSEWICLTIGSFDRPVDVLPEMHVGVESQLPWLHVNDALPRYTTEQDASPLLASMVSYQQGAGKQSSSPASGEAPAHS